MTAASKMLTLSTFILVMIKILVVQTLHPARELKGLAKLNLQFSDFVGI